MTSSSDHWKIFRGGDGSAPATLPAGPPWRRFGPARPPRAPYIVRDRHADIVNTALHLRRPLLVTGYPGVGKSSLAHAIALDLGLGEVLRWQVNSHSTLTEALYRYDAVGRLRDATTLGGASRDELPVQDYITLGPLGTALAAHPGRPRVLLIDELDKGDIDLPNDLLTVFEDGAFEIPELRRAGTDSGSAVLDVRVMTPTPFRPATDPAAIEAEEHQTVVEGWVYCEEFPIVVITSNGEREFPPAFLRRCVRLFLDDPDEEHLKAIVASQFGPALTDLEPEAASDIADLISGFNQADGVGRRATDQLLNAIYLRLSNVPLDAEILRAVLRPLGDTDPL